MLDLSPITLIALTNSKYEEHKRAMDKASDGVKWGARKIIMDYDCTSIEIWNYKILYELWHYVQTPFAFLFHADGFPINPECWRDEWYKFDFTGSPWPLPTDNFSYRDDAGRIQRVGNSVSLRSQRLLRAPTEFNLPWRKDYGYSNEDGNLCVYHRLFLEQHGFRYAPIEEAVLFGKEHSMPENEGVKTFAFHQVDQ